jgi:uncharacterized protein (DUF952 family)
MILYHITDVQSWSSALTTGVYTPAAFENDRFIHCSTAEQILDVAKRFYAGRKDLVVLTIDADRVAPEIVFEYLEAGSEQYPHIYGRLNLEAVVKVFSCKSDDDGEFYLPDTRSDT